LEQVRETLEAQVTLEFLSWTKLTMALATGSQHMNVLAAASGAAASADGATAASAVTTLNRSTATFVALAAADAANFSAGSIIALDADYTGQTGFVGAPVSGAYVRQPLTDVNYIRRVTFNVALVSQSSPTGLTLAEPLPGGAPAAGSKLQAVTGFVDREGGSFYQEWSALFVMEGSQGERISFYYPRLQTMAGAQEAALPLDGKNADGLARVVLRGQFLALPVTDPLDGERVVCYRSFLPAAHALV
jgi:phosphohistidine swiveling domain-containing protein